MTICPVAIAVGCKKCPVFSICLVKGKLGDYSPDEKSQLKDAPVEEDQS
jgi:hypothetical protein